MDRGAPRATVHGVTESQTRLSSHSTHVQSSHEQMTGALCLKMKKK